jgi:epoxyqueuosine reductase
MTLAQGIKQKAMELGFDAAGITNAGPLDEQQTRIFADWAADGFAGEMGYMRRNPDKRTNPGRLLEGAQSVICVGLNYKPAKQREAASNTNVPTGRVANYAQYEDYHIFMKKLLRRLAEFTSAAVGKAFKCKICVDSAPLAERALAARAGVGFIGKNHTLIDPQSGPQILLGEIVTDLKLQADAPIVNGCSVCNKCVSACPTGALRADGRFDARKCISYLTIEYKGRMPTELSEKIGDRLFGCDECVLACPWYESGPVCKNKEFKFYPERARLDLNKILSLDGKTFRAEFGNSVFERPGLEGLKRNAEICRKNL